MIQGSIVAIVTPFHKDGSIHYEALTNLLEWHIEEQTDAIVILGTTGESATLSKEERLAVFEHTVNIINHRIPVIAGTGSNNTLETIQFSKQAQAIGVDGLLVVSPYYNKGNNQGLIEHYKQINDAVDIPLLIYNVPSRTGFQLPLDVIKIISRFNNIIGIKEASGDISYVAQVIQNTPQDFFVFSGNDDLVLPILSLGGSGVISVAANVIPRVFSNMVHDFFNGKIKSSTTTQIKYLDLIHSLFLEVNPIPVKEVLNLMGKDVGQYRLPLSPCTSETKQELRQIVKRYAL